MDSENVVDPKKRDLFNVLDKNGRREITMAEQMTWDVLGGKEMVNIDLIHAETNEDGKLTFDEFKEQPSRTMKTL